ncbi:MAG TPA: FAD-dependent thymidylate synthase [Methylotenera mobilis]|uniref:FAD-dependent thymidylate synthase n=1 Tax=Methylotenera mobilis TaxID=359408 RepID=A0A351RD47_9PROT|nr:FAD-dependent thymidylate synthase [Methylotenera mobilis]
MKVTLVQSTPNPEEHIGLLAGICYGKTGEQSPEQCIKRAEHCVTKGHLSTLRFAHATFLVEDISRICSHQFVRSKHLDFLQRSQRYCNEGEVAMVIPEVIKFNAVERHLIEARDLYKQLIAEGVKKEDARFILPQGTTTELLVVGNFQAWYDFIKLRSGKEVQWEIREVAHEINRQLHGIAPNIFKELPND